MTCHTAEDIIEMQERMQEELEQEARERKADGTPFPLSVWDLTDDQYLIMEMICCVVTQTTRMMKEIAKRNWMMSRPSSLESRKRRWMTNWGTQLRPRQLEAQTAFDV